MASERFFTLGLRNDVHPLVLRKKAGSATGAKATPRTNSTLQRYYEARAANLSAAASTPPHPNARYFDIHTDVDAGSDSKHATTTGLNTGVDSKRSSKRDLHELSEDQR